MRLINITIKKLSKKSPSSTRESKADAKVSEKGQVDSKNDSGDRTISWSATLAASVMGVDPLFRGGLRATFSRRPRRYFGRSVRYGPDRTASGSLNRRPSGLDSKDGRPGVPAARDVECVRDFPITLKSYFLRILLLKSPLGGYYCR